MDFETILKFLVVAVTTVAIPVAAYAAIAATRSMWGRTAGARAGEQQLLEEVDGLRARVEELERAQTRMAELEERVEFTERLLARSRPEPGPVALRGETE